MLIAVVAFLAGDECSCCTGATFAVTTAWEVLLCTDKILCVLPAFLFAWVITIDE